MKNSEARIRDALEVAKLYYYHGLTTEKIAEERGVSRPKISRLLNFAREQGLVEITIHDTDRNVAPLSDAIIERFRLKAVHVVSVPEVLGELVWLERVTEFSANFLNTVLVAGMTVGCAWGTTISAVAERLIPKAIPDLRLVQLNGSGNTHTYDNRYAAQILQTFAANFGARVYLFPVPTFFDFPETKTAMWRERSITRILEMQQNADVLLYSIGAVSGGVPSHVYSGEYLEEHDLGELRSSGAVGDLATVFYRADGSYKDIAINARSTGPPLELYQRVKRAVCIVSGRAKVEGLHAALHAGYLNELIIDEPTARLLVDRL
ncbi:MAG: sugar-binding transcriptional regulator [Spirochaetota bacterium]